MYVKSLENEWPLVWTVYLIVFKERKTPPGQLRFTPQLPDLRSIARLAMERCRHPLGGKV